MRQDRLVTVNACTLRRLCSTLLLRRQARCSGASSPSRPTAQRRRGAKQLQALARPPVGHVWRRPRHAVLALGARHRRRSPMALVRCSRRPWRNDVPKPRVCARRGSWRTLRTRRSLRPSPRRHQRWRGVLHAEGRTGRLGRGVECQQPHASVCHHRCAAPPRRAPSPAPRRFRARPFARPAPSAIATFFLRRLHGQQGCDPSAQPRLQHSRFCPCSFFSGLRSGSCHMISSTPSLAINPWFPPSTRSRRGWRTSFLALQQTLLLRRGGC
mmetsp:Transcript_58908/g.164580  ORF Transcript_58908/g.164580 Transcript_58908/m.164580 type:complete len:270 (+) Transcript_58908:428-1237(+)